MIRLTKAEEQVMLILWKKKKAFVKEVLEELPEPIPAYNTVSTVIRVLEQKGFVNHETFGRTHQYYPVISQEEYSEAELNKMLNNHFSGSPQKMLSAFIENQELKMEDLDEILELLKDKRK